MLLDRIGNSTGQAFHKKDKYGHWNPSPINDTLSVLIFGFPVLWFDFFMSSNTYKIVCSKRPFIDHKLNIDGTLYGSRILNHLVSCFLANILLKYCNFMP